MSDVKACDRCSAVIWDENYAVLNFTISAADGSDALYIVGPQDLCPKCTASALTIGYTRLVGAKANMDTVNTVGTFDDLLTEAE